MKLGRHLGSNDMHHGGSACSGLQTIQDERVVTGVHSRQLFQRAEDEDVTRSSVKMDQAPTGIRKA